MTDTKTLMFTAQDIANGFSEKARQLEAALITEEEFHEYCNRIGEYQFLSGISGLKKTSIEVGDRRFSYHMHFFPLRTLPSDMEILRKEKQAAVDFFLAPQWNELCSIQRPLYECFEKPKADVKVKLKDFKDFLGECDFAFLAYEKLLVEPQERRNRVYSKLTLFAGIGYPEFTPFMPRQFERFRTFSRFGEI